MTIINLGIIILIALPFLLWAAEAIARWETNRANLKKGFKK